MKRILTLIGAIAVLASCENNSNELIIEGKVNGANEFVVYENKPDKFNPMDTIKIEDGTFKIGLDVDTPGFYWFVFTEKNASIPMYFNPSEHIELDIDLTQKYPEYSIVGSVDSDKLKRQWESFYKTYALSDSLDAYVQQLAGPNGEVPAEVKSELNDLYSKRIEDHREEVLSIIAEDYGNITNIMAINQILGQYPLLPYNLYKQYYIDIDKALMEKAPNDPNVIAYHQQVEETASREQYDMQLKQAAENASVGKPAPNIALQDPAGNMRQLSDLKGKVVMIDFWASWCRPCRMANPELVATYNKYANRGFDVFSVSLDGLPKQPNAKQDWEGAIEADKLTWENHVSDLRGWGSAMVQLYGFSGIPHTVLLDRNGIIVAKNLRGAALEAKIEELL
ncbi:MAG: AhpC/TSA family protein [Schleiferiaceae bacterium]|jgi:thiol-disulfide isomerase/thioredoxin|nr:AhpC/TSA family protein [Schleiferiaceae bacterium]